MTATMHLAVVDERGTISGSGTAGVPWWSFTKTFIAAAALRLADQGRLDLDSSPAERGCTLRQLLQHRAGFGDYYRLPAYQAAVARGDAPWTDQELLAHVPPDQRVFQLGQGWAYSNVGYLLARRAIERAAATSLGILLRDLVLAPLGLHSAQLAETPDDMRRTVFTGGHGYHPGWVFHGVVVAPVVEAALGLHRLLGGSLLSPASKSALLDRHPIGGPVPGRRWVTTGYGLGLMMGAMQRAGMSEAIDVVGHSAVGPGSVGAVYRARTGDFARTAAVFTAGQDEGVAEYEALRLLVNSWAR